MSDIDKASTGDQVIFSPSSNKADNWMRENYSVNDDVRLVFELPEQPAQPIEFQNAATEAGFSISSV